jgi:hypothetical protein
MRIPSIAQCHGMRGKVPRRMALYAGRGRLQHDLADLGEFAGPPLVAYVDLQPTEAGHAGRVDGPDHEVRIATAEAPVKRDRCVRQATGQHSLQPLPRFEDVQRPVLPIPLGRRDAVVGDCGGVTETIERDQHPASEVPSEAGADVF